MRRRLAGLMAVVAGVVVCATPAEAAVSRHTYEKRIVARLNDARAAHGLPRVTGSACVDGYTQRVAADLYDAYPLHHVSLIPMVYDCGANRAGEVLARTGISPSHVVRSWMHSPAHRPVLMNRHYRRVGVTALRLQDGRWLVVVRFSDRG